MQLLILKNGFFALSLLQATNAHMGITNFYVDGVDQGDGICIRMNPDPERWSFPVENLNSPDMACGASGTTGVGRTCEVRDGATVTFEWRENPNQPGGAVIDPSHKGSCAVYMKRVESAQYDGAAGDGWFKLWDQGYDDSTAKKWCTLNLIDKKGRMTVQLPPGLVGGEYLIRGEALALHNANKGDPQYYIGCAQVFLHSTGTLIPENTVSFPGAVSKSDAADSFDLYAQPMKLPYPVPGPPVATLKSSGQIVNVQIKNDLQPSGCLLEVGSNWCGFEVADYSDEKSCWNAGDACYKQADACYKAAPPTGNGNCKLWENKCAEINTQCSQNNFQGPPNKGRVLTPAKSTINPPAPLGPTHGGNAGQAQPTAVDETSGTPSTMSIPAQNTPPNTPIAPIPQPPTYTVPAQSPAKPTKSSTTFETIKPLSTSSSVTKPKLSTSAAPVIIPASSSGCGPKATVTMTKTDVVTVTVMATSSIAIPTPKEDEEDTPVSSSAYKSHSWPWWFTPRVQRAKATATPKPW